MKERLRSFSMTIWANELSYLGAIKCSSAAELNRYDADKVSRLEYLQRSIGLPVDTYVIIPSLSFSDCNPIVASFFSSHEGEVFSVRAEPDSSASQQTNLPIKRSHGLTKTQVFEFVEQLHPRKDAYRVRLCVYFIPELSAHVLISDVGILIEATRGKLMGLSQQWVARDEIIHSRLSFPDLSFRYSTTDPETRSILWRAIKHMQVNRSHPISPHSLPRFHFGYYEFVYSNRHGFRFVDFNQSSLFVGKPSGVPILNNDTVIPPTLRPPESIALLLPHSRNLLQ